MWEDQTRKLDTAKEATIDLVALNNLVVNMRKVVKATKVQTIHKLSRMVVKLKNKKGTEQQKKKNRRKAQRMLEDILQIKELRADSVTKFALANTATFADICKQPSASVEARSLLRLAEHRLMATKVKAFRNEHTDWRELAAYLTTKQTGRRFKTKEQKQRAARKGSKFVCSLDVSKISAHGSEENANTDSGNDGANVDRTSDSDNENAYDCSKEEEAARDSVNTINDENTYGITNSDDDSDSDSNTDKHSSEDSDNESDSDIVREDGEDSTAKEQCNSEADSNHDSSDDGEDSSGFNSRSIALSLLTKAPTTSALVEDPFFMGSPTADTDQPCHWIEQDALERRDIPQERYSKRGQPWGGRGQRPSRGGHSWSHPEWNEDDQWLRGDVDQRECGRGRGWDHRADRQTGRGTRRGSFRDRRGRGDNSRGSSSQGREGGFRGHGSQVSKMMKERGGAGSPAVSKMMDRRGGGSHAVSKMAKERGGSRSHPKDRSSHPSWEAQRKRKQMEKTVIFSGKHIKFDDD